MAEQEVEWFSVWAQPSSPQDCPALEPAMLQLRNTYHGPPFQPHVTVLGVQCLPLQLASSYLQAACRSLRPFTCKLTHVDCGASFYQCVYLLVEPSEEIIQANQHVQSSFGISESMESGSVKKNDYMPHLSLLYGDITDEDKQEAKKMVEEEFGPLLCNTQFQVNSLCLYSTDVNDKLLNSWRKVAEYALEGQSE